MSEHFKFEKRTWRTKAFYYAMERAFLACVLVCTAKSAATVVKSSAGGNAILPCSTEIDYHVNWLFWNATALKFERIYYLDTLLAPYASRFSISPRGGDYSLSIRDVQVDDAGSYRCHEDGGQGEAHEILLSVAALPTVDVETVTRQTVTPSSATAGNNSSSDPRFVAVLTVAVTAAAILVLILVALLVYFIRRRNRSADVKYDVVEQMRQYPVAPLLQLHREGSEKMSTCKIASTL